MDKCLICEKELEKQPPWQQKDGSSVGNFVPMMYHRPCYEKMVKGELSPKKLQKVREMAVPFVYGHLNTEQREAVDLIVKGGRHSSQG